jgi:hypothetical protein
VEYIYKERKGTLLPDVVDRLKQQLESQYGKETNIQVLSNTADEVDLSKLDPNVCYFQVISLQPYFDASDKRLTSFEQKFNLSMAHIMTLLMLSRSIYLRDSIY